MLAYITGVVAYKDAERAIIEAGGIGYELSMSVHALAQLPSTGSSAHVWTHLQVKEDGWSLYGFADVGEKEMFTKLIGVSGIGPKMAISALSTFRAPELAAHIAAGDITAISTIAGIGKKTAQRIVLELQGVLKTSDTQFAQQAGADASELRDASAALESLGFTADEIAVALKGCTASDVDSIIRYALKSLGSRA